MLQLAVATKVAAKRIRCPRSPDPGLIVETCDPMLWLTIEVQVRGLSLFTALFMYA